MSTSTIYYKQYGRNKRQATLQTSFSSGMMYMNGAIGEGYVKTLVNYDFSVNNESLVPRAGLRVQEVLLPDHLSDDQNNTFNTSDDIAIKAAKECVESDGNTYRQFILGEASDNKLWVITAPISDTYVERDEIPYDELKYALINKNVLEDSCTYFNVPLTKVHGVELVADRQVSSLVGTFAFGNKYYYVNHMEKRFKHTYFDSDAKVYKSEALTPMEISPSEAVAYGYNALLGKDMYTFSNKSYTGVLQMTGILPYSASNSKELLLSPRKNEDIVFRCHFNAKVGNKYKFVWEWRVLESNSWESLVNFDKAVEYTVIADGDDKIKLQNGSTIVDELEVTFKAPSEHIMVRVQAFNSEEYNNLAESTDPITEAAMTVGFDFTVSSDNTKPTTYDLTTATGMAYWKNRLLLWGLKEDPTVLFLSDLNEPLYFPYPNNVLIFDEPIVDAKVYMDNLLVFTTSQVLQITTEDGYTWNKAVLQSNLNIEPWDRHLIQIVRNMVFFKSGNYYFMIVPKSQSLTGELTLAPVSSSIKDFFNKFRDNVQEALKDTFNITSEFQIVDYFNYLDYEDMHNVYVLSFEEFENYLYFDMVYNTVSRVWRILTFEASNFLYPYKHDATQTGTLASTSLLEINVSDTHFNYEVVSEKPIKVATRVDELVIGLTGFEVAFNEQILVRIDKPSGEFDREIVFDTLKIREGGSLYFQNEEYILEAEVAGSNEQFTLKRLNDEPQFYVGSTATIYKLSNTASAVWGPNYVYPYRDTCYEYSFEKGRITEGAILEINSVQYNLHEEGGYFYPKPSGAFKIQELSDSYLFIFDDEELAYEKPIVNVLPLKGTHKALGRCLQLYKFDSVNVQDFCIPKKTKLLYFKDTSKGLRYSISSIKDTLSDAIDGANKRYTFNNWQFLDTGYRDDNTYLNKRFRELQLQLNNSEGKNLEFGLEFLLDGERRTTHLAFETEYVLDESDPNYGLAHIQTTPIENVVLPNTTDLGEAPDTWVLDQSLFPELSLWKVRIPVSGKGMAPRVRLLSKNPSRFELPGINWIYRAMNMR